MNVRGSQRKWLIGILIAIVAAAVALLPSPPAKLDLLGMIRHIHSNNEGMNALNQDIVGRMTDISEKSDTTARIGGQLHGLHAGMRGQEELLVRLNELSQKEIELSDSLHQLAGKLVGDLGQIKDSSEQQKAAVHDMQQTAKALAASAKQAETENGKISGKLGQAADMTAQVDEAMP